MPLDVGPPRTPSIWVAWVLSRVPRVRRSRVLAFGRTKVAASSEAGRPKAESSIRLVAMRKPVGAWFRAKARGLFPSIGPAGIAKLSRRCYRRRGEQKRNTKLQPIDGRRHLHSLNPEQRSAVEYGIGGNDEPPPALLIAAGAGTGKTKALAHRVAHLILNGRDPQRLLLLTFTRRAALEMTRRSQLILAEARGRRRGMFRPWVGWVVGPVLTYLAVSMHLGFAILMLIGLRQPHPGDGVQPRDLRGRIVSDLLPA
jgi:hypothetical protein